MATISWKTTSISSIPNLHTLGPQTQKDMTHHPSQESLAQSSRSLLTWNSYLRGLPTSSTVFMPDSPITVPPK